ncbi:MAG: Fur family transcriptional regulator [Pseudomonadota bacterium]
MYQCPTPAEETLRALDAAAALCAARGRRFTANRRKALQLLLEAGRPLSAYELLERLTSEGFASQPPVAYRALDFLIEQGFVHKLRDRKTFVACQHPSENHGAGFLICRDCGRVREVCVEPQHGAFGAAAREAGFRIERTVLEAEGVCDRCS